MIFRTYFLNYTGAMAMADVPLAGDTPEKVKAQAAKIISDWAKAGFRMVEADGITAFAPWSSFAMGILLSEDAEAAPDGPA